MAVLHSHNQPQEKQLPAPSQTSTPLHSSHGELAEVTTAPHAESPHPLQPLLCSRSVRGRHNPSLEPLTPLLLKLLWSLALQASPGQHCNRASPGWVAEQDVPRGRPPSPLAREQGEEGSGSRSNTSARVEATTLAAAPAGAMPVLCRALCRCFCSCNKDTEQSGSLQPVTAVEGGMCPPTGKMYE